MFCILNVLKLHIRTTRGYPVALGGGEGGGELRVAGHPQYCQLGKHVVSTHCIHSYNKIVFSSEGLTLHPYF